MPSASVHFARLLFRNLATNRFFNHQKVINVGMEKRMATRCGPDETNFEGFTRQNL